MQTSKLVSESYQSSAQGIERSQIFERADGRQFSRREDFTQTPQGERRVVEHTGVSGRQTRYEEVIDQMQDGSFRRTLRFVNEAGESATRIETGLPAASLSDGASLPLSGPQQGPYQQNPAITPMRGLYYDSKA